MLAVSVLLPSGFASASYGVSSAKVIEELGFAKPVKFQYFHESYTRAEFAYILCNIDVEYVKGTADTSIVSDVLEADRDTAAYAVEKKYLRLDEYGKFNPNSDVTFNEAIVALVTLLGYDAMAELNGGTVMDYINVARKINLTKGISFQGEEAASETSLASMVVNALSIAPATISFEGAELEQPTILERLNIRVVEAKLLATEKRGIGADVCEEGWINLGGDLYKSEKIFDDSLVGRKVHCFVRDIDGIETAVTAVSKGGKTLVLNSGDIENVSVSSAEVEIKYSRGEKVRIPHTATIIVNGKPGDLSKTLFSVFNSGTMEIFDSDNNGSFDTVDISVCITEVVESASTSGNTINTKYTKKHIDLDVNKNALVVCEDGKHADMSHIHPGSVVSIACDAYKISGGILTFDYSKAKVVKVYVSNRKVAGSLESVTDDEYIISDRSYNALSNLKTAQDSGTKTKLKLGRSYVFSLDSFGNICDYELSEDNSEMVYGYLMEAGEISKGIKSKAQIRILTLSNEFIIYDISEKYIFDGKRLVVGKDTFPTTLDKRQLIRYRVTDGKVSEIDTTTVSDEEVATTSLTLDAAKEERRYGGNIGGFLDYRIMVTNNTKVFIMADDENAPDSEYTVGSSSSFASMDYYIVEGYDIGDMGETGCMIVYESVSKEVPNHYRAYMVEQMRHAIDDDGNDVYKLKLHGYSGTLNLSTVDKSQLIFNDKSTSTVKTPDSIGKGDVIRFSQNAADQIISIERDFCLKQEPQFFDILYGSDQSGKAHFGYGQLYQSNNTHFEFAVINDLQNITPADKRVFGFKYSSKIPVYDMRDGTITLVTSDYKSIPTYLSSAQRVTVFLHMYIYELASIAVYVWE